MTNFCCFTLATNHKTQNFRTTRSLNLTSKILATTNVWHSLDFKQCKYRNIRCSHGKVCDGEEALCMLLKRTCCPCRYSDMVHLFAKPVPVISMITNEVFTYIYATRRHRIQQLNYQLLRPRNLKYYAVVVHRKGAPLDNCFGFVDGTVRPISRPECNQRIVYNDC